MYASKEARMQRDFKALHVIGTKVRIVKDNKVVVTGNVQYADEFAVKIIDASQQKYDIVLYSEIKDYEAVRPAPAER